MNLSRGLQSSTYNVLEKERCEPSKIIVVSSAYWDSLQSELPNLRPRISVSLLTALPRISGAKINRKGDSGHPCLTPRCKEKKSDANPLLRTQLLLFL